MNPERSGRCAMPRRAATWGRRLAGMVLALAAATIILVQPLAARVPDSREQIRASFAPLVRRAGPAVVNIYAKTTVTERRISPLFDDPFFRRFFGDMLGGPARKRQHQSLGSGVIVDPAGLIVTNQHVIRNADSITVILADRREFDARLLLADEKTDLAVLEIEAGRDGLPFVELRDSDDLEVGDLVLAIGNPFGVGQTVTSGIISALARTAVGITDYSFFIQTDAAINPGNSGGALIAMDGRLVGINTAIFSSKGGGGSVGIGFAVPSNMVRTVVASARGGKVIRPWLGGDGQTVTAELAREFGLDRPGGVAITAIYPGGAADAAGLRVGDIVLAVDGRDVPDGDALRYRIGTRTMGERVAVTVLRRGRHLSLDLVMRAPPTDPPPEETRLRGRHPFQGATVANLSPAYAIEHGLDPMRRGVVIVGLRRGSPAARIGLRRGDIVLEVDGRRIDSVRALRGVLARPRDRWPLSIRRDGRVLNTEIEG